MPPPKDMKVVLFPDHICHIYRENGLVNGLSHSCSICQNVGGPIRLHCISDVIHRNNGDQES